MSQTTDDGEATSHILSDTQMSARGSLEKGQPRAGPPCGVANTSSWPRVEGPGGTLQPQALPQRMKPEAGQPQGLLGPPQACLLRAASCTQLGAPRAELKLQGQCWVRKGQARWGSQPPVPWHRSASRNSGCGRSPRPGMGIFPPCQMERLK